MSLAFIKFSSFLAKYLLDVRHILCFTMQIMTHPNRAASPVLANACLKAGQDSRPSFSPAQPRQVTSPRDSGELCPALALTRHPRYAESRCKIPENSTRFHQKSLAIPHIPPNSTSKNLVQKAISRIIPPVKTGQNTSCGLCATSGSLCHFYLRKSLLCRFL